MISRPDIGRRSVSFQSLALLEPYQLTGRKTTSYVLFQSVHLKERLNVGNPSSVDPLRSCSNQSCPERHCSYVFQPVMSTAAFLVRVPTSHVPELHCSYVFQPVMLRAALFVRVATSQVQSGIVRTCSNQSCPERHCSYVFEQSCPERHCAYVFQPVMSRSALFVRVPTSHVHSGILGTCSNQSCPELHCSYVFQPVMSRASILLLQDLFFAFRKLVAGSLIYTSFRDALALALSQHMDTMKNIIGGICHKYHFCRDKSSVATNTCV